MLYGSCFVRAYSTYAVVNFNLYFEVIQIQRRWRYALAERSIAGGGESSWNAPFILVWTQPPPDTKCAWQLHCPILSRDTRVYRQKAYVSVRGCSLHDEPTCIVCCWLGLCTIKCATLRVRSTPLTIKRLNASVVKEPAAGVSLLTKALYAMIFRSLYLNLDSGRAPWLLCVGT